jgi:hypothetical protein
MRSLSSGLVCCFIFIQWQQITTNCNCFARINCYILNRFITLDWLQELATDCDKCSEAQQSTNKLLKLCYLCSIRGSVKEPDRIFWRQVPYYCGRYRLLGSSVWKYPCLIKISGFYRRVSLSLSFCCLCSIRLTITALSMQVIPSCGVLIFCRCKWKYKLF